MQLQFEITKNHYPVPTETEIYPTTIPTLFQNNQQPFTALDNIDSLTPQEVEYIMATFCKQFIHKSQNPSLKSSKIQQKKRSDRCFRHLTPYAIRLRRTGANSFLTPHSYQS